MAREADLLIEAGFSDAKLAAEVQKVVQKYKQAGEAAEKAFKGSTDKVGDSQALKAHVRELDRLKRAYDPVYTATQKYEASVKKLDRALQIGAIDQGKYTAAVQRAQVELGKASGSIEAVEVATRRAGMGFTNVGYQVQDFAVQVGSGTSATRAFAQQFPQLASGFGPVGVALGTAAAILVPLAGALFGASQKAQTLDEELDSLADTTGAMASAVEAAATPIDELRRKYGDLADEVSRANEAMALIATSTAQRDVMAAAKRLGGELFDGPNLGAYVDPKGGIRKTYEGAYEKGLQQSVEKLGKEIGATEQQAKALLEAVAQLSRSSGPEELLKDTEKLNTALAAVTAGSDQQQAALQGMADKVGAIMAGAAAMVSALGEAHNTEAQRLFDTYDKNTQALKGLANDRATAEDNLTQAVKDGNQEQIDSYGRVLKAIDAEVLNVKKSIAEMDGTFEASVKRMRELAGDIGGAINDVIQGATGKGAGDWLKAGVSAAERVQANQSTIGLIKKYEGYQPTGKWDVNAFRAGYGSDTVTLSDGTIRKVTEGMSVSVADANRDLERRVFDFQKVVISQVGQAKFDSFNDGQRAALTSVAYNYGKLPGSVAAAATSGSVQDIATAIGRLSGHNDGINAKRRMGEASAFGDTGIAAEETSEATAALKKQVQERERQLELVKQYGEQLSKNLVSEQEQARLDAERNAQLARINADPSLSEADKAAAIAEVNAEMQRQVTVFALLEEAKRRNVDLDALMVGSTLTYRQAIEALGATQKQRALADQSAQAATEQLAERQQYAAQMQQQFKDGLLDAIIAGESFSDVIADIAKQLAKAALQAALFGDGPMSGGGSGGGLLGSLISGIFGGFKADGGPVSSGRAYVVGERGPEVIIPRAPGQVIPNHAIKSGGGDMSINISLAGANGNDEVARIAQASVLRGLAQYDQALPGRVQQIKRDPRAR